MILRDVDLNTDWEAETDAFETRYDYCQIWRANVSVIIADRLDRSTLMEDHTTEFELPLPTRSDFVRYETLDEIGACRTFLGKTITEAVDVVQENQFARLDDLRHMGTPAFEFYVVAFLGAMDPSVVDLEADPEGWVFEWDVLRGILLERLSTTDSPELLSRSAAAVSSWCHRTATAIESYDSAVAEALRECGRRYERT